MQPRKCDLWFFTAWFYVGETNCLLKFIPSSLREEFLTSLAL